MWFLPVAGKNLFHTIGDEVFEVLHISLSVISHPPGQLLFFAVCCDFVE